MVSFRYMANLHNHHTYLHNYHISAYMRDVLHWPPLRQCIKFRVAVLVWYSLIGQAPAYFTDLCCPPLSARVPATSARLSRASFTSHFLAPPPCRAGPSPWMALWSGVVSHWLFGHFLEYSPRNSFCTALPPLGFSPKI